MVNNRQSYVLQNGKLVEEVWHRVQVGDVIRMESDQFVAVSRCFSFKNFRKDDKHPMIRACIAAVTAQGSGVIAFLPVD